MYASHNLYDIYLSYFNTRKRDDEFFLECIKYASNRIETLESIPVDLIKKSHSPVAFFSYLTGSSPEVVRRSEIDWSKARREFIIFDVDYNADEVSESDEQRKRFVDFANAFNAKYIIYPTISYPSKPRYRVVFFPSRPLSQTTYQKAIQWISTQCQYELTDKADLNIKMNKNLPVFNSYEQLDAIDAAIENRDFLDYQLWKNEKVHVASKRAFTKQILDRSSQFIVTLDDETHLKIFKALAQEEIASSYQTLWPLIAALAQSVVLGSMTFSCAKKCCDELSHAAQDEYQQRKWSQGNIKMLEDYCRRMQMDIKFLQSTKPLIGFGQYTELLLKVL